MLKTLLAQNDCFIIYLAISLDRIIVIETAFYFFSLVLVVRSLAYSLFSLIFIRALHVLIKIVNVFF